MNLFDEIIKDILAQLNRICTPDESRQTLSRQRVWKDVGERHMILGREMAYELGGSGTFGLSGCLCTIKKPLLFPTGVYLYGKDLGQIRQNQSYARIVLAELAENAKEEAQYSKLRELDYIRYHIHPEGYMARISPVSQREPVRISKDALQKGMCFAAIGQMYLERYLRVTQVKNVNVIFITKKDFDYAALEQKLRKAEQITQSLNHIFTSIDMDCTSCSLKAVCDEVDELRKLHIAKFRH